MPSLFSCFCVPNVNCLSQFKDVNYSLISYCVNRRRLVLEMCFVQRLRMIVHFYFVLNFSTLSFQTTAQLCNIRLTVQFQPHCLTEVSENNFCIVGLVGFALYSSFWLLYCQNSCNQLTPCWNMSFIHQQYFLHKWFILSDFMVSELLLTHCSIKGQFRYLTALTNRVEASLPSH